MNQIVRQFSLATLMLLLINCSGESSKKSEQSLPVADQVEVKVIALIENPIVNGKRFHEHFGWNDPVKMTQVYIDSMEAFSHGAVDYELVDLIDADTLFTHWKTENGKFLSIEEVYNLLSETGWNTLKTKHNDGTGTTYDYAACTKYYKFDEKRENNEVHEIWIWSWPYGGMYESRFVAKDGGFWLNSPPLNDTSMANTKLLTIMGLNYERTVDLAIHSFGHRFESIMREVYGRWDHTKTGNDRNNWEKFSTINKDQPNEGQVGNCHFPVNGTKDYEYNNPTKVITYRSAWEYYPNLKFENPDTVSCTAWDCTQFGYMAWWLRAVPHFEGIGPDQKLNNWWHYSVNYEDALKKELDLRSHD